MTYRVAVMDIRIANQQGDTPEARDANLAAWRAQSNAIWVSRARHTLVVDERDNQRRIVTWLRDMAAVAREPINVDLLCHGANAVDGDGQVLGYVARLGGGLAISNVGEWRGLLGLAHKIRLLSCGENNPIIGAAPPAASRNSLCHRLAFTTNAPVISSPNTVTFAMAARPVPGTEAAGIDAEGWPLPVYRYWPDGRREWVR